MKKFMTEEKKREIKQSITEIIETNVDRLGLGFSVFNTIVYTGKGLYDLSEGNYGKLLVDGLIVGFSIDRFGYFKRELNK